MNLKFLNFKEIYRHIDRVYERDIEFLYSISDSSKRTYLGVKNIINCVPYYKDFDPAPIINHHRYTKAQEMYIYDSLNVDELPCNKCNLPFSADGECGFCKIIRFAYFNQSSIIEIRSRSSYKDRKKIKKKKTKIGNAYALWKVDGKKGGEAHLQHFVRILNTRDPEEIIRIIREEL